MSDWTNSIEKGDVLRARSGALRIVRDVKHSLVTRGGRAHVRTSVSFLIKRCSWTKRCVTVLHSNDLKSQGYVKTGARSKLNTAFDWAVEQELTLPRPTDVKLRCCDVKGLPRKRAPRGDDDSAQGKEAMTPTELLERAEKLLAEYREGAETFRAVLQEYSDADVTIAAIDAWKRDKAEMEQEKPNV